MFRSVFADAAGIIRGTTGRTPPAGTTWAESNWAGLQIRAAGNTDPALTGFNADPNRNGLANALDLLFGIDPAQASGQPVMRVLTAGRTHAAFEVEVDAAMADLLVFHFEVSDSLGGWAPCANAPVVVSETVGVRKLRVTDAEPMSTKPGRFFRIRIEAGDF